MRALSEFFFSGTLYRADNAFFDLLGRWAEPPIAGRMDKQIKSDAGHTTKRIIHVKP